MFIYLLKKYTGLKLKEIGELFNIRYTSVSMKTKRFKEKCKKNKELNKKKNLIEGIIKKNV
jgi:chromosomal replication initiation ATPase DnaA